MYVAKQGDIVWLTLDPQAGHEQKGRRPALVISNDTFNNFTRGAAMVCPVTNTDRRNPLHVAIEGTLKITGVVMCDQAKILDLRERNAEFIEKAPEHVLFEAADIVGSFTAIEN